MGLETEFKERGESLMSEAINELIEAHKRYYEAWNQAFETKDHAIVTAFISDEFASYVGGKQQVEQYDANGYKQGVAHVVKTTAGRFTITHKDAELRTPTEGVILYRAHLQWPGGSMSELVMDVWRKEDADWKLYRCYEEVINQ